MVENKICQNCELGESVSKSAVVCVSALLHNLQPLRHNTHTCILWTERIGDEE